MTVLIALGTLVAFVLAMVAVWAFGTANRLDRLHVRYDLSWQALDSALARRAVVVLDGWSQALAEARAETRLWEMARHDPRVLEEIQAAMARTEEAA